MLVLSTLRGKEERIGADHERSPHVRAVVRVEVQQVPFEGEELHARGTPADLLGKEQMVALVSGEDADRTHIQAFDAVEDVPEDDLGHGRGELRVERRHAVRAGGLVQLGMHVRLRADLRFTCVHGCGLRAEPGDMVWEREVVFGFELRGTGQGR